MVLNGQYDLDTISGGIMLKTGDKAPDFRGRIQDGTEVSLSGYRGRKLVLYFYPKDSTPGCTAEACSLRDSYERFIAEGYAVLGVSKDSEKSHQKFIEKHSLPFPLLSDPNAEVQQAYGVWAEKKFMGRTYMGTVRTTFIIDEEGIISDIITKVDTKRHAEQILGQ